MKISVQSTKYRLKPRSKDMADRMKFVTRWFKKENIFQKDILVDKSWVVTYNPNLVSTFSSHINLEIRLSRNVEIKYPFLYMFSKRMII